MFMDAPRGLSEPVAIEERIAMVDSVVAFHPLRDWREELLIRRSAKFEGTVVPWPDPAEGGVDARILLIHEAPGPMTNSDNARRGSGFISVDNNDKTAETVWRARAEAGLHFGVLSWNIVPWYLGPASVKPNAAELREGAFELRRLLSLLPQVRVVLTSGLVAQKGWNQHIASNERASQLIQ